MSYQQFMDMPTCVGDAYIARLSMVEAERARMAAQIVMLPRLKPSDRSRVLDRWASIIAESRARFPGVVTSQIREVRAWLKAQFGDGITS